MHFSTVTHRSYGKEAGQVLVLGQGDVGQLGHGEDVLQRKKPSLVSLPEKTVQVVAGGMHTVCLSESGHVRDGALSLSVSGFCVSKINSHVFGFFRSTHLAATTKAPSAGKRPRRAPRWFQGRCCWTRRWCKCRQETVTPLLSQMTEQSSSGALSGSVTCLMHF